MLKNNFLISIIILIVFSGCNHEVSPQKKLINVQQKVKKSTTTKKIKVKEVIKPKIIDSVVWDGTNEYIDSYDYNKAIKSYIDNKYPKKVKKWKKELKRQERVRLATIAKEKKIRLRREAKEEKARLKREAKEEKARMKKERREKLNRQRAYNTKTVGNIMWMDHPESNTLEFTWNGANKYCKNMSFLDYEDWRLPTYNEFKQLYKLKNRSKLQHFNEDNMIDSDNITDDLELSLKDNASWTSTYGSISDRASFTTRSSTMQILNQYGTSTNEAHFARCVRTIRR